MKLQRLLFCATLSAAGIAAQPALAQAVIGDAPYRLTVEGFANVTAGHQTRQNDQLPGTSDDARIDAGLRLLGQVNSSAGRIFGIRVEANASPEEHFVAGERSLLYSDSWGRIEVGRRGGLPDTLAGYAPNNYTFTTALFGVYSGRTLDPGGTLATAFLPASLAARIDAISGVGFTSALFGDVSSKIIYVSPKTNGFQAGLSYSPNAEDAGAPFKRLVQGGLTHETYWEQNVLRVGGSYSNATVEQNGSAASATGNLSSLSLGASVTLDDALDLGVNFTRNGSADNAVPGPSSLYGARGLTTSVNYNTGPWTFGAYYQWARAGDGALNTGLDRLQAAQVGASYRINTKVRFYGAYYDYQLRNEGNSPGLGPLKGGVFLLGTRIAL